MTLDNKDNSIRWFHGEKRLLKGVNVMLKTLCVFGTRPEAIKMAPLIIQLNNSPYFDNKVCVTGQHQQMLYSVLKSFEITPDFALNVMTVDQDLNELTARILTSLSQVLKSYLPDIIFVHGDTTTTFAAALCAYYHRIPVAHIEAGLRTGDLNLPWPEEGNRKLSDALSTWFFAPTMLAKNNLLKEGVNEKRIVVTGNTVVDALLMTLNKIDKNITLQIDLQQQFSFIRKNAKVLLVTGHRRESFGHGFERICQSIAIIAKQHPEIEIVYPVHLNPNVQRPVFSILGNIQNVHLIDTVDYIAFVYLMRLAYIILTDSGGIQEEAPSLGIPVLVMRDKTERQECILDGTVKLVGTEVQSITSNVEKLLTNPEAYKKMQPSHNPYGDGTAANKTIASLISFLEERIETI